MQNYFLKILNYFNKNTLPTPKTIWNFEYGILALQTILSTVKRGYIEKESQWNQSYEFIKNLRNQLLQENIPATIFELHSPDHPEPIGFVLDCAGAFWSYKGINGIEKILEVKNLSLKNPYFLTEINEMDTLCDKRIFKNLNLEKTTIIKIYPTGNYKFSTPLEVPYLSSSDFLKQIEDSISFESKEARFNIDAKFSSTNNHEEQTSYSKYKSLIKTLKNNFIDGAYWGYFEKKQVLIAFKRDLKDIKHLFKKSPTHSFLVRINYTFVNLKINLSNQKKQLIFLKHMGLGLEFETKDFHDSEIGTLYDKESFFDIFISFLNLNSEKQPYNFFYTYENWSERLKDEYGFRFCSRFYRLNQSHSMEEHSLLLENHLFQEIPKLEQECILKESMYNIKLPPQLIHKKERF